MNGKVGSTQGYRQHFKCERGLGLGKQERAEEYDGQKKRVLKDSSRVTSLLLHTVATGD